MNHPKSSDYSVKTVELILSTLEIFASEEDQLITPVSLGARLSISRNKAYRLLSTLEQKGFIERDESSGAYRIGLLSIALSQKILKHSTIIDHSHPIIEDLARKHDEAVYMTVLKGEEVVFIDMADCTQPIRPAALLGNRFPLFSNAAGKLLKALETSDIEGIFKQRGRNAKKIDFSALITELSDIRKKGFAVDYGGLGDGVISVAVAVRDYAGKVVGALTLLGPSFRLLSERLEEEVIPSLMESAESLSARFGYVPI
jgi:DNA-binding IclR family transcriptional regulator